MPEPIRSAAERVCTRKQLDVLELTAAGFGSRRVAIILGISRDAARARLSAGLDKVQRELDLP